MTLNEKEIQIIELLSEGNSISEVAKLIYSCQRSVYNEMGELCDKIGIKRKQTALLGWYYKKYLPKRNARFPASPNRDRE